MSGFFPRSKPNPDQVFDHFHVRKADFGEFRARARKAQFRVKPLGGKARMKGK
jgi:hypothetical protein